NRQAAIAPFCLLPTAYCLLPTAYCLLAPGPVHEGYHIITLKNIAGHAGGPKLRVLTSDHPHTKDYQKPAHCGSPQPKIRDTIMSTKSPTPRRRMSAQGHNGP